MNSLNIDTYDSALNYLKTLPSAITVQQLKETEIKKKINLVAEKIFNVDAHKILELPKMVKITILRNAIDEGLASQGNLLRYIDPDVVSDILTNRTPHNTPVLYQYCTQEKALYFNGQTLSHDTIINRLHELPPEVKRSITLLDLSKSPRLSNLSFLADFPNVAILNLAGNISLTTLDGIEALTNLEALNLSDCQLQGLGTLDQCLKLKELIASGCRHIQSIAQLASCTNLRKLNLDNCNLLQNVSDTIENLTQLTDLSLVNLKFLQSIDFCKEHTQLHNLNISGTSVKDTSEILKILDNLKIKR